MNLDKVLSSRRSIRKFSSKKVPYPAIIEMLNAASLSPSSGNVQNWRFIIVNDKKIKHQLALASLKQMWMEDTPLLIVVCAEASTIKKYYEESFESLSLQNCAIAANNLMLKATDLGIGSCYVSIFDANAVSRALRIPELCIPEAILALGYPDEEPEKKRILPLDTMTFYNEHGNRKKPKF